MTTRPSDDPNARDRLEPAKGQDRGDDRAGESMETGKVASTDDQSESLKTTKPILAEAATVPPRDDGKPATPAVSPLPERIGRFKVERVLGTGGFAAVYLGLDPDLRRQVAIKVPLPRRISDEADIERYLIEARILASLDHPNIVPVHEVGRTDDGLCFVVSKFVEGADLREAIEQKRFSWNQIAELVAAIAEALHCAHTKGLVHRDVKPANILIDAKGKPYLADFGIALRDEDCTFHPGDELVGTPTYMSPEQARGEGHLVDGRSDVFSLGVVLYEMLTGVNPFKAPNWSGSVFLITTKEAKPPRQINDLIPKELERICLKALEKRVNDRYTTAKDLADDLKAYLNVPRESRLKRIEEPRTSRSWREMSFGIQGVSARPRRSWATRSLVRLGLVGFLMLLAAIVARHMLRWSSHTPPNERMREALGAPASSDWHVRFVDAEGGKKVRSPRALLEEFNLPPSTGDWPVKLKAQLFTPRSKDRTADVPARIHIECFCDEETAMFAKTDLDLTDRTDPITLWFAPVADGASPAPTAPGGAPSP